jgi:hypothetical protein
MKKVRLTTIILIVIMVQSVFLAIITYPRNTVKPTESVIYNIPLIADDGRIEIANVCVAR